LPAPADAEGGQARAGPLGSAAAHLRARPGRDRGGGRLGRGSAASLGRAPGCVGSGAEAASGLGTEGQKTMTDKGEMMGVAGVRFVRRLPGPIETVWRHLTDPDATPGWYAPGSVLEPREGGRVALNEGHIRGVVTQWRPGCRLAHTWNVFMPGED